MSPLHAPIARDALALLPGSLLVLFLVRVGGHAAALAVPPADFVDGLRAARALFGFDALHRDEVPLDELLPWAGCV